MRFHATPILAMLMLVLTLSVLPPVEAAITYTLTASPNVMNLGSTATLTLSIDRGQNNQVYTTVIEVRKPNATGRAVVTRVIVTDNRGVGTTSFAYPDISFTSINGSIATDVVGVYDVIANQTSPSNLGIVATAQFTVSSQLTVAISRPSGGNFQRGQKITITATASDLRNAPATPASVVAISPFFPNGRFSLAESSSLGVYEAVYEIQMNDPIGSWTIQVEVRDFKGNYGISSTVGVSVARSDLAIEALTAYNSNGEPSLDFDTGDTIYPFFRIKYSSGAATTQYLTTGQYKVGIRNSAGSLVANLTAVYDSGRFGFYTPTGYGISAFESGGSWSVVVDANSMNDGFGNVGPTFAITVRVQVVTSLWSHLPFLVGGAVAILGGVLYWKRFNTSLTGFDYLEHLIGGAIPRGSTLLILGETGSGKTILSYQLLWDELETRRQCAILSYDAFPEDVQARMKEFGWDIIPHLRKGRLKIVDCYSGLAGEGEGAIREPSDLTETNIQITSFVTSAKGGPVTLVLDSLTPIFNGVEAKQAIAFLQTVGAKIKKTGGIFIITSSVGALPAESIAKIKSIVDGVIELSQVRAGRHISRYLSVVKMERRRISPDAVPIEIDRRRGLVFRVSRVKFLKNRMAKGSAIRLPQSESKPKTSRGTDEPVARQRPT